MTVCNMSIEAGARAGMVAPDETTFAYLKGRPRAPQGAAWDTAVADWQHAAHRRRRGLRSRGRRWTPATLEPMITYGTHPGHGRSPITGNVPARSDDPVFDKALAYMGFAAGQPLGGRADRRGVHRQLHQRRG